MKKEIAQQLIKLAQIKKNLKRIFSDFTIFKGTLKESSKELIEKFDQKEILRSRLQSGHLQDGDNANLSTGRI